MSRGKLTVDTGQKKRAKKENYRKAQHMSDIGVKPITQAVA